MVCHQIFKLALDAACLAFDETVFQNGPRPGALDLLRVYLLMIVIMGNSTMVCTPYVDVH